MKKGRKRNQTSAEESRAMTKSGYASFLRGCVRGGFSDNDVDPSRKLYVKSSRESATTDKEGLVRDTWVGFLETLLPKPTKTTSRIRHKSIEREAKYLSKHSETKLIKEWGASW